MSVELRKTADFYRIARGKKPAAKMLLHVAIGLAVLMVWASLTPISDSVAYVTKIVPRNEMTNAKNGSLNLSTAYSGKVVAVPVREREEVTEGDVLICLDSEDLRTRRDGELEKIRNLNLEVKAKAHQIELVTSTFKIQTLEIEAQLDAEKKRIAKLTSEKSIKLASAESELMRAAKERDRSRKLVNQRAISESELDVAEAEYLRAKEKLSLVKLPLEESRVPELESREESLESGYRETIHKIKTEILALESRISSARTEFALYELKIEQCNIVAPIDGHVSTCSVSVGDWVSPGALGITVSQSGLIAEAFLPSQLIGNVKSGDRAKVLLDGIDWIIDGSIDATVTSISPELCHEEVVMGDGTTQIVDGYRVLFELKPGDFKKWSTIRIGMTGLVQIETGQRNLAVYLLEKAIGDSFIGPRSAK